MKQLRIWLIKRKLRAAYLSYCNMLDRSNAGQTEARIEDASTSHG